MDAGFCRFLATAVTAILLLAGCAAGPPARPPGPVAPLPPVSRSPQDLALEQALGEFYGAPYRAGGTTPTGVDCSGLVQALLHRAGANLPRTVAQQYSVGQPVRTEDLRFGDVVFFNRYCQTRGRDFYLAGVLAPFAADEVCHNGVYLGQGRFVHASPRGVQVSRLDAEIWRSSYRGGRRYLPLGR